MSDMDPCRIILLLLASVFLQPVSLHVMDEDTLGITCYVCVNVTSNYQCNRFAIDTPCPAGLPVCHNVHVMQSSRKRKASTVVVNKKCATHADCAADVGCRQQGNLTVCVSCCDQSYCNEEIAHNESSAVFQRSNVAAFSENSVSSSGVAGVTWRHLAALLTAATASLWTHSSAA